MKNFGCIGELEVMKLFPDPLHVCGTLRFVPNPPASSHNVLYPQMGGRRGYCLDSVCLFVSDMVQTSMQLVFVCLFLIWYKQVCNCLDSVCLFVSDMVQTSMQLVFVCLFLIWYKQVCNCLVSVCVFVSDMVQTSMQLVFVCLFLIW